MLHTTADDKQSRWPFTRQEAALIAITVVWGATFLVVHLAMQHSGPFFFVGLRFLTAGAVALLVSHRVLNGLTRQELAAGFAVGVTIFLGYGLQTMGLQTISSSKSAFITAFYVPLVPLLQWLVLREAPRRMAIVGIVLAFAGLVLLAGPDTGGAIGRGELATIASAGAIAAEILLIGRFARRVDVRRITAVQLLVAGLLSFAAMPVVGEAVPGFSWVWLAAAVGLGGATVLIQLTINWAQRAVAPVRATIIYAGEPVWGGVVGRLAGDRLPPEAFAGAALVLLGTLVSELKPRRRASGETPAG